MLKMGPGESLKSVKPLCLLQNINCGINFSSRAMDKRNKLFMEMANIMKMETDLKPEEIENHINNFMSKQSQGLDRGGGGWPQLRAIDKVNNLCSFNNKPSCSSIEVKKFRTASGECNNLQYPYFGASHIASRRYVKAKYIDSVGEPFGRNPTGLNRNAMNRKRMKDAPATDRWASDCPWWFPDCAGGGGGSGTCPRTNPRSLPSPRVISRDFHFDINVPDANITLIVMQFGQFVDHDLTFTPETENEECCAEGNQNRGNCFSICIPRNDPFIALHGEDCLEFTRSTSFCERLTSVREQMNEITAFVDASNVYGSDDEKNLLLRTLRGGLLKSQRSISNKELLPEIDGRLMAGDERALEMPALTTMHTLFLREHNRLAREIASRRPNWNDEKIYNMARKIVGGQMQNVVYGQFLTTVLGRRTMQQMKLDVSRDSHYNPRTDPSIRSGFSTAAYRFGHTLIQGMINMRILKSGNIQETYLLRDNFFNTDRYFDTDGNGAEKIIYGILDQRSQSYDQFITEDVSNFLVPDDGLPRSDLIARNLQRSRDHGLASYNEYRKFCDLEPACSWDRPPAQISAAIWRQLSKIYENPNDIELFTGGLAERPFGGGVIGETFNCIVARQFRVLKDGDRFFFTHCDQHGGFTSNQLRALRQRNLGDIICDNTDIPLFADNVFLQNRPLRSCRSNFKLNIKDFI